MAKKQKPLSVLVYIEPCEDDHPDFYIAHCLEWDVVAQSVDSELDALKNLVKLMVAQRELLDEGKHEVPEPAPNEYREMYESGIPCVIGSVKFPEPVKIRKVV